MRSWKLGIQLYTLRNETIEDFPGTLRKVAEQGFEGVEFSHLGFLGMQPEELKPLLDELGLKAIGAHIGSIDKVRDHIDEEIANIKAVGGRYLATSLFDPTLRHNEYTYKQNFRIIAEAAKRCREQGIAFCFHNHEFELTEHVGGKPALDALMDYALETGLQVELDACWLYYGGKDPLAYIRKYKDSLPLLHYKDMRWADDGKADTVELGRGVMDLKAIAAEVNDSKVEWLIYEQDHCRIPPLASMSESMAWLKANLL